MASATELPLLLFTEHSSSFCSSLRNDLDQFIDEISNSFMSVNRTVKIAPKQRRKNKHRGAPGSCTLDLKEFTASKQSVLHKLQSTFETMEQKWSNDIAGLKDWFLQKIETCLSKVQLEIKVSAEDINLLQPIHEVELCEERPKRSEIDEILVDQSLDSYRSCVASPPVSSHVTDSYSQGRDTSAFGHSNVLGGSVFQRNMTSFHAGTGRPEMKRGAKVAMMSRKEIASVPGAADVSDSEESCASFSTGAAGINGFLEDVGSLHEVSPPPVANSKKISKEVTGGRGQTRRGAKAAQLSKAETSDAILPDSGIAKPPFMSKVSYSRELPSVSVPPSTGGSSINPVVTSKKIDIEVRAVRGRTRRGAKAVELVPVVPASDIEEPAIRSKVSDSVVPSVSVPLHTESHPPPTNTLKRGKKGTGGRGNTKRGETALQVITEEISAVASIPDSGLEKPAAKSNFSDSAIPHDMDGFHRTSYLPPANAAKRGKTGRVGRGNAKKGARATSVDEEAVAIDSDVEEQTVRSKVTDSEMFGASVPHDVMGTYAVQTSKKTGTRGAGRAQVKRGIATDSKLPNSGLDKPARRGKVSDLQDTNMTWALEHPVVVDNVHATKPPPANTRKMNRKGTGRATTKKGANAAQLYENEIASHLNVPNSGVDEPALRSKMSDWQSLFGASENVPCKPGLFEVKVWRAKKPAFIGHTDDLQKSISLYREGKPSGEKHLDQFIQRNKDDISVRYELYPSVQLARLEQKKRLKEFMEKHKNLPSYNYGL